VQQLAEIINDSDPPKYATKMQVGPTEVTPAAMPEGRGDEAAPVRPQPPR
jgi:hypothetical protein